VIIKTSEMIIRCLGKVIRGPLEEPQIFVGTKICKAESAAVAMMPTRETRSALEKATKMLPKLPNVEPYFWNIFAYAHTYVHT
jgi:hypothetical protein